jgi:anti-sigma regulatory factor (Ser/Thr protein kinase)
MTPRNHPEDVATPEIGRHGHRPSLESIDGRTSVTKLPNVRLSLSSRPENVLLVREMLTGVAEAIDLDRNELDDIRTAVTEACNNVVLHAYGHRTGPLRVELHIATGAIEVMVGDHGGGIKPRIRAADEHALGIGLSIIQALTRRVEFSDVPAGGTEVRMEFDAPGTRELESLGEVGHEPPGAAHSESAATTGITIAPTHLARTVLPRVLCVLAARAHFSTDRISDTQLVADALVAHAPRSISAGRLDVSVIVEPRNLRLRVGPLDPGSAQRLITESTVDGLGSVIDTLVDDRQVATVASCEELALHLIDRR